MAANKAQFIGVFANDAEAIAFVQAQKWDAGKGGDTNPWPGMFYVDSTSGEIKVWTGSSFKGGGGGASTQFYVNPFDPDAFQTVNEAYAAALLVAAAGEPIFITLSGGQHTLSADLNVTQDHDLVITALRPYRDVGNSNMDSVYLNGNFVLEDATSVGAIPRRKFQLWGMVYQGNVTANPNWIVMGADMTWAGPISRTHGGTADIGVSIWMKRVTVNYQPMDITDTDTPVTTIGSSISFEDGNYYGSMTVNGNCNIGIRKSTVQLFAIFGPANLFVFGGGTGINVTLEDTSPYAVSIGGGQPALASGGANATFNWNGRNQINNFAGGDLAFDITGSTGSHAGAPFWRDANFAPVDPPVGTTWEDLELNETLIWDGTYWDLGGGLKRIDQLVDIGGAAADHAVGADFPDESVPVSGSINLQKDLTAGGGAVQVGLGTGSALVPDKYGETSVLTQNSKGGRTAATLARLTGADIMFITAETAPGTAGGTVAGSGSDDARVLLYFYLAKTLPNA